LNELRPRIVSKNPYQLAKDIYGMGFFSADKIALNMGFERDGGPRIEAGINHVLAASRDEVHCYLTDEQIVKNTLELLEAADSEKIRLHLNAVLQTNEIKKRMLHDENRAEVTAYYSKSLFFDELYVASRVTKWIGTGVVVDLPRVRNCCGGKPLFKTRVFSGERDLILRNNQNALS
jgi:exodeoxyribonuclease V alpha subunit